MRHLGARGQELGTRNTPLLPDASGVQTTEEDSCPISNFLSFYSSMSLARYYINRHENGTLASQTH